LSYTDESVQPAHSEWAKEMPVVIHQEEASSSPRGSGVELVKRQDNPLGESHYASTACQHCFKPDMYPGIYNLNEMLTHKCEETMLAMRSKDGKSPWVRVRERKNHREFPGHYVLCNSIKFNNYQFCKFGEELCTFAHNEVEKYLWRLEKDGGFDISEYILQIRKHKDTNGFSLLEYLAVHTGYFEFICRACRYGSPPQISMVNTKDQSKCSGRTPHKWRDYKIMAFFGPNAVIPINVRGFTHKSAFFKMCNYKHFCQKSVNAMCKFAHSVEERDIWRVERDTGLSRDEIVRLSKDAFMQGKAIKAAPAPQARATPSPGASQAVIPSHTTVSNLQLPVCYIC